MHTVFNNIGILHHILHVGRVEIQYLLFEELLKYQQAFTTNKVTFFCTMLFLISVVGTKEQLSREVASALTFEWGSLWSQNIH